MADDLPSRGLDELVGVLVGAAGSGGALVLGQGSWSVVDALAARGVVATTADGDWPGVQLSRRYGLVLVHPSVGVTPEVRAPVLHCAVQHARPGGLVVTAFPRAVAERVAARFDLEPVGAMRAHGRTVRVHRRTRRFTVHDLVFEARRSIGRISALDLEDRLGRRPAPTVLDTRTDTDRLRFGVIPGALHVPRTVLEWRLDPANGYRHPAIRSFDQALVVVCNGGYSSSLAAANLVALGFSDVVDLVGGHHAWVAAGLPVVEPDHSHLDL